MNQAGIFRKAPGRRFVREWLKKMILTGFIGLLVLMVLFPLILTMANSFMSEREIFANYTLKPRSGLENDLLRQYYRLKFIPDEIVLKQYYTVLVKRPQFLFMFWNSVFLVAPIILGQIVVGAMAAYAFSRFRFRGRDLLFFIYIITMLMPFQVTLVPNYIVADRLGLIGTYGAIIYPGIFGTFGVFLLRQFMVYIPESYSEAARVDGAGHWAIFWRIILPMTKSGLAALGILVFIDNWNMVEQPLIFLQDELQRPLSVYLSRVNEGERGIAFAAAALYMAPLFLIFLYGESYLIEGIQLSGIKG